LEEEVVMAIQWGKKRERRITADSLRERLLDSRIIDDGEFYDRQMVYRQLEILLPFPQIHTRNGKG